MKDIKVRAWDKRCKCMNYLNGFNLSGNRIALYYYDEEDCRASRTEFKENVELMQYTGLHDKNGKEIYDGDILKIYDYIGSVEFGLHDHDIYNGWYVLTQFGSSCELNKTFERTEIIGNIHENLELLKEAE